MPKISVIVPIYKVEKYLWECVDSILAQTFKDFELISVGDGSPDGCGAICDEYRSRDERVVVIHKQNGGVTMARQDGVERSRGGSAVSPDCYKPVSHIVYHALMVWWRLSAGAALRVSAAFSKDIVDFAIKYSYDKRLAKILRIFKLSPMLTYLLAQIKIYFTKKR